MSTNEKSMLTCLLGVVVRTIHQKLRQNIRNWSKSGFELNSER